MLTSQRVPTEEEWKAWLDLPETTWLRQVARLRREEMKNQWEAGRFTDSTQWGQAMLNANAIGKCEAYTLLEELDYSKLLAEIDYEEPVRFGAEGESGVAEDV